MWIVFTLLLFLAVILNLFGSSSQFDCLPNGAPISFVPRSRPPNSSGGCSPERTQGNALARPSSSRHNPPAEHELCDISRCQMLGFALEDLRSIRLISYNCPNSTFELQRYAFPPGTPIQLKTKNNTLKPIPAEEQIVLSKSNGDVFAILEKLRGQNIFRGIYVPLGVTGIRAKINMVNGLVQDLTPGEIAATPLGNQRPITKNFRIERV